MKIGRRQPTRGMTLLELLIALTLVAGIATMLLSATQLSVKTHDRAQSIGMETRSAALRLQLRRWLATATPPSRLTPFDAQFSGTSDQLSFVTLMPAGFSQDSAALRVTLDVGQSQFDMQIIELDDMGEALSTLSRSLSVSANDLHISYLEKRADGRLEWVNSWSDETQLPQAVRISRQTEESKEWPDFTVALIYAAPTQP